MDRVAYRQRPICSKSTDRLVPREASGPSRSTELFDAWHKARPVGALCTLVEWEPSRLVAGYDGIVAGAVLAIGADRITAEDAAPGAAGGASGSASDG